MLLERIIPYHTIPYHIPLLPRDIIEIHSRKPAFGLFSSCLVSSKSQPCCCNAQCRLVLKCEKLLGSNCSVMDLVTDYWVNNFATSSPVLSDEQAPAGSRDSSRDPGLFWIPIPIPENFFQNRDWDQNRDLSSSTNLLNNYHFSKRSGNFMVIFSVFW